jgi:predicted membrane protein
MKALRAILGVAFIVAVLYCIWMLFPPYFHNYELQDAVADEARMNTYTQKSEDDMRESIWRKVKDMEIPLARDQINVQRDSGGVAIWMDYTVHVDLPAYPVDLKFHTSSKNKNF